MAVRTPVYLDHNATTPIDPRVLEVLQRVQRDHFGNPASNHALGWAAARIVERSRQQVADLIGAEPGEIIFTSGATQANNLALLGACTVGTAQWRHLVTTTLEHDAVEVPLAHLERRGWQISRVPCGPDGVVDAAAVADALRSDTVLVSIIMAQNEIGTLQPIAELGKLCRKRGIVLHSDAAQAGARIPLDVRDLGVGLLSLSAHKMYGPKGVGALFVSRRDPRVTLQPVLFGGGQERGLWPGTVNVPAVAAFGEACRLAALEMEGEAVRLQGLTDRLLTALRQELPDLRLNGGSAPGLPGCLNISFPEARGHSLATKLPTLAVSSGSACSSTDGQPSRILQQLGRDTQTALASLRIGMGRTTTLEEVEYAAGMIIETVRQLG